MPRPPCLCRREGGQTGIFADHIARNLQVIEDLYIQFLEFRRGGPAVGDGPPSRALFNIAFMTASQSVAAGFTLEPSALSLRAGLSS